MPKRRLPCLLVLLLLLGSPVFLFAQEPELSADEPITADFETQELVARGNARFEHQEVIVEADVIRFNQATRVITATGNVRVTRRGLRVVSDRVTYALDTRYFTSGPFRAGTPPLFVEGESFEGTFDELTLQDARFYYLEPDSASPTLILEEATIRPGERVAGRGVGLDLPFLGAIPLPSFERDLDAPTLSVTGNGGYRSNLGVFLQSEVLLPVDERFRAGANFDLYSRRGVLLGPALRYRKLVDEAHFTRLSLSGGWIADQGGADLRGVDVLGDPVPFHRYLGDFLLHHRDGDLEVVTHSSWLSDSEVERDFREERYVAQPHPESFLEINRIVGSDVFLSVFLERNPNRFFRNVERVPELTVEVPLRPVGETGLIHAAKARYLRFRSWGEDPALETWRDGGPSLLDLPWPEANALRFDTSSRWQDVGELTYSLRAPWTLGPGLSFTPVGELNLFAARALPEDGSDGDLEERDGFQAAVGFDFEVSLHADFDVRSEIWNVTRLRHLLQPVVQLRRFEEGGDPFPGEAYPRFDALRPELDYLARRDRPILGDGRTLLRSGVRNSLLATDLEGNVRELASLGVFHDAAWDDSVGEADLSQSDLYLELAARPARWLEFRLDQRFGLEDGDHDETRLRALLRSAEAWELELALDYFEGVYHQYRAEGAYRLNARSTLIGGWRFDARRHELTRQFYGIRYQLGQAWIIDAAIVFRSGARREDDIGFEASVRLVDF